MVRTGTLRERDLVSAGLVEAGRLEEIERVAGKFAVALTTDVAALIDPADPADPIAAQFVPNGAELEIDDDERADPIGDMRWSPVLGIVHRYPDRVLLKPTLLCPVYCRFCFRREVVGKRPAMLDQPALARAFDYIRQRPEIWEVIVTGGDPFVLAPRRLADIVRTLDQIPHLAVIRFHTRVPVADPRRVTPALIEALAAEKAIYVVVHANHPRELTPRAREALTRLSRAGIPLLSQTVLLRGVNDDAAVLEALFRGLVAMRVKPYYLHHADLARGTAHFRTGIAAGQRLVRSLRGRISGLCQPTYVLDIPGGYGKVPIAAASVSAPRGAGGWIVEDPAGGQHAYPADPEPAMAETDDPVMIVVGGGAIALSTAQELCALQGHRVVVLWRRDPDFTRAVEGIGAVHIAAPRPDSAEALDRAGVRHAVTILALSPDDQVNLHAALLARDANPRLRIVLRQFNRTLAHKIEQNLPDCSVLSLAWHSAATYAAAALDPACFRGLQFPEPDGPLTGFATRIAESCGVGGESVTSAEQVLGARILAVDGKTEFTRDMVLAGRAEMVVYGDVVGLQSSAARRSATRGHPALGRRLWSLLHHGRRHPPRLNPILVRLALAALVVLLLGIGYFHAAFKGGWLDAVYFVVATMTTTGYGDLTPDRSNPVEIVSAMLLMLAGTILTGLFIAFGASLLTRVHWVSMQGLRPVHRRGHIVVCGAGSIGSEVIGLLLALGKHLVVVEISPDTAVIERAREERFDLLTGDASRDATLDLCNLNAADGLIALTNVDTLNLEIALGARARNPTMPVVLRIAEASFAASIARHFEFETTYSAAALAAPAFVGLSRFPDSRGRVAFAGQEFAVAEVVIAEAGVSTVLRDAILLAISRQGGFAVASDFAELAPGDRALIIAPVAPSSEPRDALAAPAETTSA